ncbi:MAG TPA: 4Fe-4S binding protein, partial [Candidatus Binatia bacterium]
MIDRRKFLKRAVLFIPAVGLFRRLANDAQAKTAVAGYDPSNHLYGMGIDIDKCIGCGRCVEACKTENNVPKEPFFFRTWVERYT